mgnify:FL=1
MPSPVSHCLLIAALMLTATLATAAPATDASATGTPKKKPARVTFVKSSSGETASERERRLIRECRGRPDAGACLGYAR